MDQFFDGLPPAIPPRFFEITTRGVNLFCGGGVIKPIWAHQEILSDLKDTLACASCLVSDRKRLPLLNSLPPDSNWAKIWVLDR